MNAIHIKGWVGGDGEVGKDGWVDRLAFLVDTSGQVMCSVGQRNSHSNPRSYHKSYQTFGAVYNPCHLNDDMSGLNHCVGLSWLWGSVKSYLEESTWPSVVIIVTVSGLAIHKMDFSCCGILVSFCKSSHIFSFFHTWVQLYTYIRTCILHIRIYVCECFYLSFYEQITSRPQ